MIRLALLLVVVPCVAVAGISTDIEDDTPEPPALSEVSAPCLRETDEQRYVVTWEIRNTETGERRSVGSQEVRLRC